MTPHEKRTAARQMLADAKRLFHEAHDERPLPDFWRVGQQVRMLADQEWAWNKGAIATVIEVENPERPARDYQVFFTRPERGNGRWFTTPDDVELVGDAPQISPASA